MTGKPRSRPSAGTGAHAKIVIMFPVSRQKAAPSPTVPRAVRILEVAHPGVEVSPRVLADGDILGDGSVRDEKNRQNWERFQRAPKCHFTRGNALFASRARCHPRGNKHGPRGSSINPTGEWNDSIRLTLEYSCGPELGRWSRPSHQRSQRRLDSSELCSGVSMPSRSFTKDPSSTPDRMYCQRYALSRFAKIACFCGSVKLPCAQARLRHPQEARRQADRVAPARCGTAASSRCPRARRCDSATRTGRLFQSGRGRE